MVSSVRQRRRRFQRSVSSRIRSGCCRGRSGTVSVGRDAAGGGPEEEVADVAVGVPVGQPGVQTRLVEVGKGQVVLVEPGQQFEGDGDLGAEVDPGDCRLASSGSSSAGAA
jgi:hypothetical protein